MKIGKIALIVFAIGAVLVAPIESKAATQIGDSNLYYEIDNETLTISGTGDAAAYNSPMEVPWYNDNATIKNVIIESTVEVTNMDYWFNGYEKLSYVEGISDTVTSMNGTFSACTSLKTFNDFPKALKSAEGMFNGCEQLQYVADMPNTIENCHGMFMNCKSLTNINSISTSAKDCQSMFFGCINLVQGPEIIPATASNISTIFSNCSKLSGFIWIEGSPTAYDNAFSLNTGTSGTGLKIYYSSMCGKSLAEIIVAMGTSDYVTLGQCTDKINFSITYDLDGGTNATDNPDGYRLYDERIVLGEPTKIGYDFVKWVCGSADKNAIEKGEIGDITFKAIFTKYEAPKIITDLSDLHLRLNDSITIAPEVTGDHLQYKWFKNGNSTVISTEPVYTVQISSLANNGDEYYCIIYNDGNTPVRTSIAKVYVHDTPNKPFIETDLSTWKNGELVIKAATFDADDLVLQYSLDNATWISLPGDSLIWETETAGSLLYFRFVSKYFDTLLSESEIVVVKYDNTKPEITELESSSDWTAEDSIVNIRADDELSGVSEYYLFDNVSAETPKYSSTNGVFKVGESGSFFAAVKDLTGNIIRKLEKIVIRVDKEAPNTAITFKGIPSSDATLNLSWEDDKSGVDVFYWGMESDNSNRKFSKVGDFSNYMLTVETPGTFYLVVVDKVGNVSEKVYTLHKVVVDGEETLVPDKFEYILPELSKKGYSLEAFNINGAIIKDNFIVTDNVSAIPVWSPDTYTINYETNGGNVQGTLKTMYTIEDNNFVLPNVTKDFSNFLGWRIKGTNDEPLVQYVVDTAICSNLTLEAVFDEKCSASYRINYYLQDVNGYSYELDTAKRFIGEAGETVEGIILDYEGFTVPETQTVILEEGKETVIDYYYVRNRYRLTVNTICNEDRFSQTLYYRYGEEVRIDVPDKIGYTTNCDKLIDGAMNFTMPACDKVVDIKYVPIEFIITYVIDSDVINNNPDSYNVTSDDIILCNPTKIGYNFLGWRINGSNDEPLAPYIIKASTCSNIELIAVWGENKPIVTEVPIIRPTITPDITNTISPDVPGVTNKPTISLTITPTVKPTVKPTAKPTATPLLTKKITPTPTSIPSTKVMALVCNYTKTIGAKSFFLKISNPSKYKLSYFRSNSNVSVTSYGKVTLKKVGSSTITVVASNGNIIKVNITIRPKVNTIKTVKALGNGKIKISFNKAAGTSGYQIRYSTNKNFTASTTKTVRVSSGSASKTILKLKKNKKYYVSIRNYRIIGSKVYYSNWSSTKSVKVK